jgi:hypothetical protein
VKLSRHVADKGPFASQVLAPGGQIEPNSTFSGAISTSKVGEYMLILAGCHYAIELEFAFVNPKQREKVLPSVSE